MSAGLFKVLSLDGGGAKGFYTLGVLKEVEALAGARLSEVFDLIFGTSTGAIVAALLALGKSVDEIIDTYRSHVVTVMGARSRSEKSAALTKLADNVFGSATFADMRTDVGIVATRWAVERPMIFKSAVAQAHGRDASFVPGFGCSISDAVQASCAVYPFFERKFVTLAQGETVELLDGGYCANNPTLYAIADAKFAFGIGDADLRVLSVGVGEYPLKPVSIFRRDYWINKVPEAQLIQKTFDINTQSMEQLRSIIFAGVRTTRINEGFTHPSMATDMFEHDLDKLSLLRQRGSDSYGKQEGEIRSLLN